MIQSAPDAQTRQRFIEDRDRRNREERAHKAQVEVALIIDALLLLLATASLLRGPSPELRSKTQGG